jgi:type III secretion system FlhB-like substrate exporter
MRDTPGKEIFASRVVAHGHGYEAENIVQREVGV